MRAQPLAMIVTLMVLSPPALAELTGFPLPLGGDTFSNSVVAAITPQVPEGKDPQEEVKGLIDVASFVPNLALSFMHCKNVQVKKGDRPDEALQKSRVSKGKPRLSQAHVIVIDPMKKAIRTGTGSNSYSTQAVHIVRGHFKTFRDENKLFGKMTGTYWWAMHVAGEGSEPALNQYEVNKPVGGYNA